MRSSRGGLEGRREGISLRNHPNRNTPRFQERSSELREAEVAKQVTQLGDKMKRGTGRPRLDSTERAFEGNHKRPLVRPNVVRTVSRVAMVL